MQKMQVSKHLTEYSQGIPSFSSIYQEAKE